MSEDAEALTVDQDSSSAATNSDAFPLKKSRGGQRKDGAPAGSRTVKIVGDKEKIIAPFVPNPAFKAFYSDHDNPAQKTKALWAWWNRLPTPFKDQVDAYLYRDWPVLLDPIEDWCPDCKLIMAPELGKCPRCGHVLESQEYKYIDIIVGTQPIQNDQDFIDKYGAGNYRLFLNANPPNAPRRTLCIAYVKGSHAFREYPPTNPQRPNAALSLTDPLNAAYVAWLRSQGKIPDEQKERDDMTASAEVTGKLVEQNTMLMGKLIDVTTAEKKEAATAPPAEPARTPEQQLNESLGLVERLAKLTARPDGSGESAQMFRTLMDLMDRMRSASDPAPYLKLIAEQGEKIHQIQLQHLNDKLETLQRSIDKPPQTTVTTTDGTNISSLIEKAVEKAVEKAGIGEEADTSWWVDPLKQLVPVAIPVLLQGLSRFFVPQPSAQPQPQPAGGFPGPGAPQPQPQLSAPAPQPTPQAQAQQATPEQIEAQRILVAMSGPIVEQLGDSEIEGDDFADWMLGELGSRSYQFIVTRFKEEEVLQTLYVYPMIAPNIQHLPRERVAKFVHDFMTFDPKAYNAKLDAREKGGAA